MRVSSVRIVNYKSLSDTGDISLGPMNVLVGRNNHGKSAFIRAVHMLQADANRAGSDIRLGHENSKITIDVDFEDSASINRHYLDLPLDGQPVHFSSVFVMNRAGEVFAKSTYIVPGAPSLRAVTIPQIEPIEPRNFIYTYLSKRKVLSFDRQVDLQRTRGVQSNLSNIVSKVSRLANPDYIHAEEYRQLCEAMLGFRVSVYAAQDGAGQQAGIPVGEFGYIPIESMGEGVSSQLGLITDLCMADGNLFLIEEPENDIHPEGLKKLLNVIVEKSSSNQFIISTHSNIVTRYLGAAPDSKIFEFESDYKPNEVPTSRIREVEPTVGARVAVLRRLGYELSDFDLWDGWLILEESSAEVIIRYLIPWFAPELSRIRTVAAGGTPKVEPTFEDFRRLFLFAHLEAQYKGRAWVVVDGDETGKEVVKRLRRNYRDWPPQNFASWQEADFERYYPSPQFGQEVDHALTLNHQEKRTAKKELLDRVKAWCGANPEEAKEAFSHSAAEVIEKLKQIRCELSEGGES